MIYEQPKDREANRKRGEVFDQQEFARKAKRKEMSVYDPIFERIISTSMLHHALAISFDVPVNRLSEMIDIKSITLDNGPALQVVVLP